ncbi:hypothetical protein Tco_0316748 [Tanacetum coccineum]
MEKFIGHQSDSGMINSEAIMGYGDYVLVTLLQGQAYRIDNKMNSRFMETIHVTFDEMHQTRAPEFFEQFELNEPVPSATAVNAQVVPPGTPLSTTIAQDAPSTSASSSISDMHLKSDI